MRKFVGKDTDTERGREKERKEGEEKRDACEVCVIGCGARSGGSLFVVSSGFGASIGTECGGDSNVESGGGE